MENLEYCPNCGQKLKSNDDFCPNCGFNVKKYVEENSNKKAEKVAPVTSAQDSSKASQAAPNAAQQSVPTQAKTVSVGFDGSNQPPKKNNKVIVWIVAVIVVLLVGYMGGNWYYGKNRQVQNLQDDITSGKTDKMQSALIGEDGKELSTKKVGALKRLYVKDSSSIQKVRNQLKSTDPENNFSVKATGKYLGIYNKYKIQVRSQELSIETNIDNPVFTVDNKNVAAQSDGDEYKVSDLTPGIYDLTVESNNKSSQAKSKQVTISIGDDDSEVTMNVKKEKKAKTTVEKDTDDDDDNDVDTNDDDRDEIASASRDNSFANDNSRDFDGTLIGDYTGDPDLSLYSDGSYQLGDKSGTYQIVNRDGNHVQIKYNQNGGGSITESYSFDGSELYSSKYDTSWYKWN